MIEEMLKLSDRDIVAGIGSLYLDSGGYACGKVVDESFTAMRQLKWLR